MGPIATDRAPIELAPANPAPINPAAPGLTGERGRLEVMLPSEWNPLPGTTIRRSPRTPPPRSLTARRGGN